MILKEMQNQGQNLEEKRQKAKKAQEKPVPDQKVQRKSEEIFNF